MGELTVANDPTQGQRNVYASPFTFTDENGAFTIVPYNFSNSHDPNNFHNIVHVSVRGVGTDYECQGRCTWDILDEFGNTHMSNPSNLIFNLKRVETGFEIQTPPNTIVSSGVNDHFYAGNSLLVSNMTVLSGANSDFTARQKIRLNPSFHALAGSNIHVFTSASKPECIEFDNFMRLSKPITSILSYPSDQLHIA